MQYTKIYCDVSNLCWMYIFSCYTEYKMVSSKVRLCKILEHKLNNQVINMVWEVGLCKLVEYFYMAMNQSTAIKNIIQQRLDTSLYILVFCKN